MDPFEGTHLGECWRTDLRFTHFNLVIPFLTFFILLHSSLRYLGKSSFAQMKLHGTVWNWFLSQDRNGVENMAFMDHGRLEASCFQVWSTFFCCFFWWGWTYCAPNSFELEKPFNAHLWGVTGYRPLDGKTYDFISRNWIPLIFVASPFSPTSPPFGPLFHAFFPPQVGWVLRVPRYGRVCVCMEHMNKCKTSNFYCQ